MNPSKKHTLTGTAEQGRGDLEQSSYLLMAMTLLSRVFGLVRIRVLSSMLGATALGDLLFFTLNIPNNFRKIFAEGAFSSAYIPEYSRRHEYHPAQTRRFFLFIAWVLVGASAVLFFIFFFLGEHILMAISDFPQSLIQQQGAVLLGVLSLYMFGIILSTAAANTLHIHRKFFIPSLAPIILSVTVIAASWFFYDYWGIYAMGWGFALGALIPLFCMVPVLVRLLKGSVGSFKPSEKQIPDQKNRRFFSRWGILICLSAALFIAQQVSYYLASTLHEGSVIQFSNAVILWQMPVGVFFTSIMTVLYPALSHSFSKADTAGFSNLMNRGIVYIAAFLIPSSIFLGIFSREITSLILLTGNYTQASVDHTARILQYFAPGLVMMGITQLFLRKCYIRNEWKTAIGRTGIFASLDIILSILLIQTPLGLAGLPAAFSISYTVTAVISLKTHRIDRYYLSRLIFLAVGNTACLSILIGLRALFPYSGERWIDLACYLGIFGAALLLPLIVLYQRIGISLFSVFLKKTNIR